MHSGKARAEIRQYLRTCQFDESTKLGRLALEALAEEQHLDLYTVPTTVMEKLLKEFGVESVASLYASIGLGKALAAAVLHRLMSLLQAGGKHEGELELPAVMITAMKVRLSISPLAAIRFRATRITGMNRPGLGLTVHRADCPHAERGRQADPGRWMNLEWGPTKPGAHFPVPLEVRVTDAHAGLAVVATSVAEANSSITAVSLEEEGKDQIVRVTVQVRDKNHLIHVMRTIRQNEAVLRVKRILDDNSLAKGAKNAAKLPKASKTNSSGEGKAGKDHQKD